MQVKEYESLINDAKNNQEVISILHRVNEDLSLNKINAIKLKELMLTKQIQLIIARDSK